MGSRCGVLTFLVLDFEPLGCQCLHSMSKKVLFFVALATAKWVSVLQALLLVVPSLGRELFLSALLFFVAPMESPSNPLPRPCWVLLMGWRNVLCYVLFERVFTCVGLRVLLVGPLLSSFSLVVLLGHFQRTFCRFFLVRLFMILVQFRSWRFLLSTPILEVFLPRCPFCATDRSPKCWEWHHEDLNLLLLLFTLRIYLMFLRAFDP